MPNQLPNEQHSEALEDVHVWGECGEFYVPGSLWLALLELARLYGWKPAGTGPPDPECSDVDGQAHDGSYYPPYAQIVTQDDAKHLAQALERVLPDIPHGVPEGDHLFAGWHEEPDLMQRLGAIRATLQSLIEHCMECGELWLC